MDGYKKSKPLYFFVLRTGTRPALDISDEDNDKLLRQLIADNSSRIFRTDLGSCKAKLEQPAAALTGSSLPFGCWDNPKVAANVSRDLHVLAVNDAIPWSTYKWLDIHGFGMNMPESGYDHSTGYSYEPVNYIDRTFDTRVPQPGKEIAIVSTKWGEDKITIKYISLGDNKSQQEVHTNKQLESIESQVESQIIQSQSEIKTSKENTKTELNSQLNNERKIKPRKAASEEKLLATSAAPGAQDAPRLRAHRPQLELEPEDGLDDADRDIDPDYGKPEPYKFGKRLSFKLPWRSEARETQSGPQSCSSSISSAEGSGETWTKSGSLPAIFRKRGKRPEASVASHPLNQSGSPTKNGSVQPDQKSKKLSRMRRFRNSVSDIFKSKSSKH